MNLQKMFEKTPFFIVGACVFLATLFLNCSGQTAEFQVEVGEEVTYFGPVNAVGWEFVNVRTPFTFFVETKGTGLGDDLDISPWSYEPKKEWLDTQFIPLQEKDWSFKEVSRGNFRVTIKRMPRGHVLSVRVSAPSFGDLKNHPYSTFRKLPDDRQDQTQYYCDGTDEAGSYLSVGDSISVFLPHNRQKQRAIFSLGGCWEFVRSISTTAVTPEERGIEVHYMP